MLFGFLFMGAPDKSARGEVAAIAIGLGLTLIHLVSIPVTNTSVNPARSTGPGLLVGSWALDQLWLFWIAPVLGAVTAGGFYRFVFESAES
jgi:aquaporin Z